MSEDFLLEQKKSEKYQHTSCNRKKNFTRVNFDVFKAMKSANRDFQTVSELKQ